MVYAWMWSMAGWWVGLMGLPVWAFRENGFEISACLSDGELSVEGHRLSAECLVRDAALVV